ncbi:MAG TPA: polyphosphate kinase 1 [Acidimicrobiales bacterium]|jgi:polyphosphate kinase|nr:polyphosphate kinase 1 [Acidimicrobiales bacterium]
MALQRTPPEEGGGAPVTSDLAAGMETPVAPPATGSAPASRPPPRIGSVSALSRDESLAGERRTVPVADAISSWGYDRYTNKELSRLDFLSRLLDLAEDTRLPLLEQVKFMAIFAEALDEFFQVRVSGLQDKLVAGVRMRSVDGLRPGEQLAAIRTRVEQLVARQDAIFLEVLVPALGAAGIRLSDWTSLDDDDRSYLVDVYDREIYPVLTPLAVDPGHPFPYISNLSLNLLVEVGDPSTRRERIARVKVPPVLPRFIVMPDGERFVPLEQVIAAHLHTLFPGMAIGEHDTFRVTRNADLALEEDEADDLLVAVEMELRRRRFGSAVRLEITSDADPELIERLRDELDVPPDGVYTLDAPIDLSGLWAVYALDRPDLHAETWTPMTPPHLANAGNEPTDLFQVLRERDVLVHHPYDSFATSVEAFVAEAADDPEVLGIKQTLYRTSGDSPIVASLIKAAEAGKQVAAIVELKARFDEQANIGWAKALEEAGVHVVYGLVGLKTHSKTVLVLRREDDGIRRYCHVGTGNYNSRTAAIYEDLGLLTSDDEIGADVGDLFNFLTGYSRQSEYREIFVAPVTLRERMLELIARQTDAGPAGRIVFKVNGLTDPEMIDALYAASRAGVPVDLAVRGMCSLRPGVRGLSETIEVRSIVGQFLEHSRIYRFGGTSEDAPHRDVGGAGPSLPLELYIGSADLMERNLDRRIEVLTPVRDRELQGRLLEILDLVFTDDVNAWALHADGNWERLRALKGIDSQRRLKELAVERARRRREVEPRQPETSGELR